MIVVRVELWSARTGKVSTLGVMKIANDGTEGNGDHGCYDGKVMRKPEFTDATRRGRLVHWPRRSKTIWHMVAAMLESMGYGQKEKRK